MTFSEQLKYIMKRDHLSQKQVAATCHICRSTVSEYVNGKKIPSYETAKRILADLGYELGLEQKCEPSEKKHIPLSKNASGYSDPTACKAIRKADHDRERMMKLLDVIFTICDYAGFRVAGRIPLEDKKTGKIWR